MVCNLEFSLENILFGNRNENIECMYNLVSSDKKQI